jgi:hypothetical protein
MGTKTTATRWKAATRSVSTTAAVRCPSSASRRIRNETTDLVPLLSLLPLPPRPQMAPNNNKAQKRLKVSVRRLPADLPEEVFWRTAAPWVSKGEEQAEGEGKGEGEGKEGAEKAVWAEYKQGIVRKRYASLPSAFESEPSRGGAEELTMWTCTQRQGQGQRQLASLHHLQVPPATRSLPSSLRRLEFPRQARSVVRSPPSCAP